MDAEVKEEEEEVEKGERAKLPRSTLALSFFPLFGFASHCNRKT